MRADFPAPDDLRALARALPSPAPEPARVAKVRERVLAQAAVARRRAALRSGAFVGLALAAGAVLAIGLRNPNTPSARYHGTVTAAAHARFTRASAAPDELVVLEAGTIHVEVSRLGHGERFRVRAGDGEVEVRGTAFDVTVGAGHLERVAVEHGRVEVRRPGAVGTVLGPGEHWAMTESGSQPAGAVELPHGEAPPPLAPSAAPVRHKSGGARAPESVSAPAPAHEPDVASRLVNPPPPPSVVVPPRIPTESPRAVDTAQVPAGSERDEERRERRDERRERHDQRRLR